VIKVHIEFLSWLGDTLDNGKGGSGVVLEQTINEGITLKQLLVLLARKHPRFAEDVFDTKAGKLSSGVSVLYNSQPIELVSGLQTRLKDGDHLIILPVVEGG
jgi:molybdopterin synthase sulfur carrier subunit